MNKIIVTIAVVVIVLVGGYFIVKIVFQPTPAVPQVSNQQVLSTVSEKAPATEGKVVTYTNTGYSPATITIKRGEMIVFKNQSLRSMWPASAVHPTHRIYSGTSLGEHCPDTADKAFDACKGFSPGESWSFKFDKTGAWKYHNHLSPGDTGAIVVE